MIGILYTLVSAGILTADCISGAIENHQLREDARKRNDNPYGYYLDRRGNERLISTNQLCSVNPMIDEHDGKDVCVRDIRGNVIRNLTEEKREERRLEAIEKGRSVYLYREYGNGIYNGTYHRDFGGDGYCEGAQFKDLKNGNIYVARNFYVKDLSNTCGDVYYYMDFNGKLVRESDCMKFKRASGECKISKESSDLFIKNFNESQDKNGYNNTKNDICIVDNFGKATGKINEYALKQYYCNNKAVSDDC